MALAESASRFELAPSRESFSHIPEVLPLPNLIQTQTDSFHWFVQTGLRELLDEITPITDFTGKNLELHFRDYYFEEPKFSEEECRTRDLTFSKPLKVEVDLVDQGDRRGQAPDRLHGRLPVDDGAGHLHHQRRRARGGEPAGALAGRVLHRRRGSGHRPDAVRCQGDPEPRRLARVRDQQQGPAQRQGRPQAEDPGHHAAARRGRRGQRRDAEALRAGRRPPRASVRPADARQGHRRHPGRGPDRGLQEAAPRRSAHGRQRPRAGHQPLLQLPPLRPGPGRPLQAEQGPGRRRRQAEDRPAVGGEREPARRAGHQPQRHHRHHRQADRAEQRPRRAATTSTTWATGASAPTAS